MSKASPQQNMETTLAIPETLELKRCKKLRGTLILSGDPGIASHALLLAALAPGVTRIENLPDEEGTQALLAHLETMGCSVDWEDGHLLLTGGTQRLQDWSEPFSPRHETDLLGLLGITAGLGLAGPVRVDLHRIPGEVVDNSLRLLQLGFIPIDEGEQIESSQPFRILEAASLRENLAAQLPGPVQAERLHLEEHTAKTILLYHQVAAGKGLHLQLRKSGIDHLENLLLQFQAPLVVQKHEAREMDELARRIARQMRGSDKPENPYQIRLASQADSQPALQPPFLRLPGDVTLGSLYLLAATLVNGSDLVLDNFGLNSGRMGFLQALKRMGADIEIVSRREKFGETFGQVRVRTAELMGKRFGRENLEGMRDEIPLLIMAAAFAEGETILRDIGFMRTYGNDLLKSMINSLKSVGVEIGEVEDGLVVRGKTEYDGGTFQAFGHPVLGAAYYLLGMKSHGITEVRGIEGIKARFPGFLEELGRLTEPT